MKKLLISCCFFLLFLFPIPSVCGQSVEIRILHVNDFHGFVEPHKPIGSDESLGGITYLAARVDELRKKKPSLLLSAGDMIQGHNWATLFRGESGMDLMNVMGFDAMVAGNHEFDFGKEVLRERISEAKFPILGANAEGLSGLKPYVLKGLSGIRIAIIGLITEDIPAITHPRNFEGLKFFSSIETAKRYVRELRKEVDLLVVLSHMGYPADRMLAEEVKGIDVIVGGHTHTKLTGPVYVKNTVIVQAWENGKALGILDLTIKDGRTISYTGHLEEIRPSMGKEDHAVQEIIKKYNQKMDAVLNQRIGETEIDLDGERRNVRRKETNFGNLIADIIRQMSNADLAIMNGGGIRASIRKGEIRARDVYTALPFDNYTVAVRITGKQIKEALEHGVSTAAEEEGRFPQVSGLTFSYSLSAKRGSRTREILVAGKPMDPDQEYVVATNDFLAVGGDGYKVFAEPLKMSADYSILGGAMKGEKIVYSDPGRWLRDVVVEYIKEQRRIAPKVEGRIKEIE